MVPPSLSRLRRARHDEVRSSPFESRSKTVLFAATLHAPSASVVSRASYDILRGTMRPNHGRALAAGAVFLLCSACVSRPTAGLSEQQVDVALSTAFLPNDGPLVGISNLMFDTLPSGLLKLRPEWRQVEFDVLSKPTGFRPV